MSAKNFGSYGDLETIFSEYADKINNMIFTGTKAEWAALSDSDKAKYRQVNITDDEGGTETDYYSIEETKTNKVWIDGKPIYRKSGVSNISGTSDTIIDNTLNTGTIVPIKIDAMALYGDTYIPIGWNSGTVRFVMFVRAGGLEVGDQRPSSLTRVLWTIEYTKA